MLNFKLTRLFWNKRATFGMLEEESFGFRCYTVERPFCDCTRMTATQKTKFCLPTGTYPMMHRFDPLTLRPFLALCGRGVYREAHFCTDRPAGAGSIAVGKSYDESGVTREGKVVLEKMSQMLETAIGQNRLPTRSKSGLILLDIALAADFREKKVMVEEEPDDWDEVDFDCID